MQWQTAADHMQWQTAADNAQTPFFRQVDAPIIKVFVLH